MMIKGILLSSVYLLCNIPSYSGCQYVQGRHADVRCRQKSVIKCAVDNFHDGQLESNCKLCIREKKGNGSSVYMKMKNQNETCPRTCTQTGKMLLSICKKKPSI